MIKLVLSDLDQTLLDTPRSGLTARAASAIRALMDCGVVFGPCTGRSRLLLPSLFGPSTSDLYRSGVFDNGMVALLNGELVFRRTYDAASLASLARRAERERIGTLGVCGLPWAPAGFVTVDSNWLAAHGEAALSGLSKANIHLPEGSDLVGVARRLEDLYPELDFVNPTRSRPILDVLASGCSKAPGARALAEAVGASLEEVLVFGDSDNDLEVLGAFTNSAAVADAKPAVLERARWVVGRCEDDGVAQALEALASRLGALPR
ncbi:HAD family hydrolase [Atopobiaceae bacterium 24-176]